MHIGMVGLGKMGMNLVANMRDHDIEVTAFDLNDKAREEVGQYGAKAVASLDLRGSSGAWCLLANRQKPRLVS